MRRGGVDKFKLMELVKRYRNVSRACRRLGCARQTYYDYFPVHSRPNLMGPPDRVEFSIGFVEEGVIR